MPGLGVVVQALVRTPCCGMVVQKSSRSFDYAPISHFSAGFPRRFAQDDKSEMYLFDKSKLMPWHLSRVGDGRDGVLLDIAVVRA